MIRVCIFCEKWGSGGIESFLLNILANIDRDEFKIHIITATLESDAYLPRLREMGMDLTVLTGRRRNCHTQFLYLYRALRNSSYDVIHCNLFEGVALGYVKTAELAGIPVRIAHSHNNELRESFLRPVKLFLHKICKWFFRKAPTHFAACSNVAAEFLFEKRIYTSRKWLLIKNGIDERRFLFDQQGRDIMRRELGIRDQFVIGCIGRLCYQKNQKYLLEVFVELQNKYHDAMLVLVGEGEDYSMLNELIHRSGLSPKIVLYGVTDRVPELLWSFDVLAMPSIFEGLGIVAIEAQAAGLPVICSEHVPRETRITDLIDYLPLGDLELWARKLLQCRKILRRDTSREIQNAGYSIKESAQVLQELWASNL